MNGEASPPSGSWLRAVVHIGPMKTGTTALAISLAESTNSGRLAPDFVYPLGDLWASEGNPVAKHHSITSLAMTGIRDPDRQNAVAVRRQEVIRRLDNLVRVLRARGNGRHSVFLIAEGATNRVDPVVLTGELLSWFDEVAYCLVARGQVPAIESSLSHAVRKSVPTGASPNERAVNIKAVDTRRFDYSRIVARWGFLENARLIVVPFLEGDIATYALFDRLFSAAGLPPVPREADVEGQRLHSSISVAAERELRLLATLHRGVAWQPALRRLVRSRFATVTVRAQERSQRHDSAHRRARLNSRKAEIVRRRYAQSNAELRSFLADAAFDPAWEEWFAAQHPARHPQASEA